MSGAEAEKMEKLAERRTKKVCVNTCPGLTHFFREYQLDWETVDVLVK